MSTRPAAPGASLGKHRTTAFNLTPVTNYPGKLVIYQLAASPFWWVRYFQDCRIFRRSTRETNRRRAMAFARDFYDEINYRRHQGLLITRPVDFSACAYAVLEQQDALVTQGEMSLMMQQNDRYRLHKAVLPYFQGRALSAIDFFCLQAFVNQLGAQGLTAPTISNYLGLVRKTLGYAQRRGYIVAVPEFPRLRKDDAPRGWFNTREYRQVAVAARGLQGQVWEVRKLSTVDGQDQIRVTPRSQPARPGVKRLEPDAGGQLLRRVQMSPDLYHLVVFMANGFIRPTDIKWMQHKHVEVIRGQHTYLRLSLPASKRHDKPIVTLPNAVRVYLLQRGLNQAQGLAGPEDHVFLPEFGAARRAGALTQLQRQFSVLMAHTGLAQGARGEDRSLYSLRHTCIMFRLLYGDGLDLLTLARNARTSPDMIDRFYASHLQGEMNVGRLQGRRSACR